MHQAIIISAVIMGLFSIGFGALGPVAKVLYPNMEVADLALPMMILDLMPGWLAGLILAAPLAAVMSTVDSMLLVTTSAVVKDLYLNYINPKASQRKVTKLSYLTTLIIGVGTVLLALTPPDYLQLIVVFAMGGLEATFFVPLVFGLYWKRANRLGAVFSMYAGLISYIVITQWWSNPFGMHTIATSLALAIVVMVATSLITPAPSRHIIQKFWGKGTKDSVSNPVIEQ
jgi:sodium/pantothenate symporter